jgi:hypothetical protein
MAYFACKNGNSGGGGGGTQLTLYERGTSHLGEVQKSSMSTYLATFGNDGITFNNYSTASSDFITNTPIDISDWDILKVYGALAGDETSESNKRWLAADLKSVRAATGTDEVYFTLQRTGNNFYAFLSPSTSPFGYTNGACVFSGSNTIKIFKIWLEKYDEAITSAFNITVEAAEGSVVTCTKDSIILSKTVDSSQKVNFNVPESGSWVVSDGTNSKTVTFDSQNVDVSFLFNPVLYELGTFNAAYENPGEFQSGKTELTVKNGALLNANNIYLASGTTKGSYKILGFSDLIDLSSYSTVRFYTNANFTAYKDINISNVSEGYIALFAGRFNDSTGASRVTGYVSSSKSIVANSKAAIVIANNVSGSNVTASIYKIELLS